MEPALHVLRTGFVSGDPGDAPNCDLGRERDFG
jgi:hypothetical protein